jgi:hypothetical protein
MAAELLQGSCAHEETANNTPRKPIESGRRLIICVEKDIPQFEAGMGSFLVELLSLAL